jgi:hypothetical protein
MMPPVLWDRHGLVRRKREIALSKRDLERAFVTVILREGKKLGSNIRNSSLLHAQNR